MTTGTMLTEASSNLMNRKPEEHYPDLPTLITDARAQKDRSTTADVDDAGILYVPGRGGIVADLGRGREVALGHYARQQLGTLSGVPVRVQDRLSPRTLAQVLNETAPRDHNGENARQWLLQDTDEGQEARAITSQKYERLWDADLYAECAKWLPEGWEPAYPELHVLWEGATDSRENVQGNEKPALFRSDRDSFAFFHGPRADDGEDFGGLRPGLMAWNSEVGASSFGFRRFYFRAMCCNFLIWDASEIKERRARHTKQVTRIRAMFSRELRRIAQPMTTAELDTFAKAAAHTFEPFERDSKTTAKNAANKLYRLGNVQVTQAQAVRALEAASFEQHNGRGGFLSSWDVANGLTWTAKEQGYAKDRAALQTAAGVVMAAAQ
jgi:hypothetical protein